MEDQNLTKKQRRELHKAAQTSAQVQAERQAIRRKWFIVSGVILGVVALVAIVRALSGFGQGPTAGSTADPIKGNASAAVRVVEYSDFQCPYCASTAPLLTQAAEEFGDQIVIEYNDFPLTTLHDNAFPAAEAAQCAFQQNAFWEYHDKIFVEQNVWKVQRDPLDTFTQYATDLGLNTEQFTSCMKKHDTRAGIREDMQEGERANVNGTPTIFINGTRILDTQTYAGLSAAIQQALNESAK